MSARQESESIDSPEPTSASQAPQHLVTATPPDIYINAAISEMRAVVAETYCTKEEAREIKNDINKRIGDIWKVVIGIVVPLVLAILALVILIFQSMGS